MRFAISAVVAMAEIRGMRFVFGVALGYMLVSSQVHGPSAAPESRWLYQTASQSLDFGHRISDRVAKFGSWPPPPLSPRSPRSPRPPRPLPRPSPSTLRSPPLPGPSPPPEDAILGTGRGRSPRHPWDSEVSRASPLLDGRASGGAGRATGRLQRCSARSRPPCARPRARRPRPRARSAGRRRGRCRSRCGRRPAAGPPRGGRHSRRT